MDLQITSLFLLAYFLTSSEALFKALKTQDVEYDRGEPLILTPLLEQEQIREARRAAIVNLTGVAKDVKSYAGYFTVNKKYNSNQFFWFFPSKSDPAKDPVLVWLQGGPGVSSMYGVLVETGPFFINKKQELALRKYSWVNNHSVIYIDNPVGTGFSFTKNEDGYARNETQIGNELYETLRQFFKLFSDLRKNEFYIHGESYAAKYALALAHTIHKGNPHAQDKINLKGVAIGDGYIDPEHQTGYAEYLYQLGLVDEKHADEIKRYENAAVEAIRKGDYILSSDLKVKALVVIEQQANVSFYNYLKEGGVPGEDQMNKFLNQSEVRRSLHVGETTFGSEKVEAFLADDLQRSVASWLVEVANNYRLLLYSGQLDIIVAYPLTLNMLKNLEFKDAKEYRKAKRKIWYIGNQPAGYSKSAGNFTEVLVRDAGHIVPYDQPKWAEDLISRFTRNKSF